ncbi:hypothetical protein Tco_0396574 [Tanacetum coccineum]
MQIVGCQGVVDKKKDVIQYPHFTKLIIADLMKKFDSIPPRLEEDYHFIRDDISLVSVYSTRNVTVRGMLIPDEFNTDDIRATKEYKESPSLTTDIAPKKKRKHVVGETISPRKSLKVTIKQKKPSTTPIPPPCDDRERDEIAEATLLKEEIEKMFEGEEHDESYASSFVDSMLNDDDDSGTRIEPGSHKEHPETINDDDENEKKDDDDKKDDDNDDHTDHTLVETQATGSMETRKEKMHTPIPSPTRSPRKNLSLSKILSQGLMEMLSPSTSTTSKVQRKTRPIFSKYNHILGVTHNMCRSQERATNYLIKGNLKIVMADTIIQEHDALQAAVPALVSKEFVDQAPQIIEELFKSYVSNNVIQVHPTASTSTSTTSSVILQQQLYLKMKSNLQDQAADPESWDVLKLIDEDEEIPEDTTPELIDEFQNVDKHIPTIYDYARMMATLNDVMSNQFKDAEEYAYHLEQTKNYMENQIVWERGQEDIKRSKPYAQVFHGPQRNPNEPTRYLYIISLYKIHVVPFLEDDLEEN